MEAQSLPQVEDAARVAQERLNTMQRELMLIQQQSQIFETQRGHVQGNVVILPRSHADDFLRYCQRNPKPCPVLAVSEPGRPELPTLGEGIDIRTDVPRYRVWRDGELVGELPMAFEVVPDALSLVVPAAIAEARRSE